MKEKIIIPNTQSEEASHIKEISISFQIHDNVKNIDGIDCILSHIENGLVGKTFLNYRTKNSKSGGIPLPPAHDIRIIVFQENDHVYVEMVRKQFQFYTQIAKIIIIETSKLYRPNTTHILNTIDTILLIILKDFLTPKV